MTKLTIAILDTMSEYVASQVETGKYSNVSEYFCDLVRRDREENAREELRRILTKAEASGISNRTVEDIWKDAEKRHSGL